MTTLQILLFLQDNAVLCNEVNEKVVQHFVQCIESHGKHVQVSSYFIWLEIYYHIDHMVTCQEL